MELCIYYFDQTYWMSTVPLKQMRKRTMSVAVYKSNLPDFMRSHRLNQSQIQHKKLKRQPTQNSSILLSRKKTLSKRMDTQITSRSRIQPVQQHKPLLNGRCAYKALQDETERVAELFRTIKSIREYYGVLSLDQINNDQDDHQTRQIPYYPQLYQMNQQISQLKTQIQNRMTKIFKISKLCPKVQTAIERLLDKHSVETLQGNQRYAKVAAMKAHTRLIAPTLQRHNRIIRY